MHELVFTIKFIRYGMTYWLWSMDILWIRCVLVSRHTSVFDTNMIPMITLFVSCLMFVSVSIFHCLMIKWWKRYLYTIQDSFFYEY